MSSAMAVASSSSSSSSALSKLLFLLLVSVFGSGVPAISLSFGINYGQIANNLPSPSRVSVLLRSLNITKVKLYDADPHVLSAFSSSGVDFIVSLGNEYLLNMTDPIKAQDWVEQYVQPFIGRAGISCIAVGNEVFNTNNTQLMSYLLPAMQTVYSTLSNLGLEKRVTVTSAHTLNILGNSYPPSSGAFRQDLVGYIKPLLEFHSQIKSPFLVNAYPYFAYMYNPEEVPLAYVLFQPNPGMTDPKTNFHYDNMLFAQIDAIYSAMEALGHSDITVRISETGWPSQGDPDEAGANPENARLYNGNLLQRIEQKRGTPGRPDVPLDVYVFALFNENQKPGPTSERNYGLYYPDGRPVYDLGFQGYLPELVSAASTKRVFYPITLLVLVIHGLVHAQWPATFITRRGDCGKGV